MASFCGTSFYDWKNIWLDLSFLLADWPAWLSDDGRCAARGWCPGCRVHTGFAGAYGALRGGLLAALRDLGCAEVGLVGHSLGGTLAALAAMELRACHGGEVRVTGVWTYGMPRIGNEAFVQAYVAEARAAGADPPMWRLVHGRDLIPRVPPRWLLGYRHLPEEVLYLPGSGSGHELCPRASPPDWEDPACERVRSRLAATMQYHHAYLGKQFTTDENEASARCVSSAEMERKQAAQRGWAAKVGALLLLAVLACLAPCVCCCLHCCRLGPLRGGGKEGNGSSDSSGSVSGESNDNGSSDSTGSLSAESNEGGGASEALLKGQFGGKAGADGA